MQKKNIFKVYLHHNCPSLFLFRDKRSAHFVFIHESVTCGPGLVLFQTNFSCWRCSHVSDPEHKQMSYERKHRQDNVPYFKPLTHSSQVWRESSTLQSWNTNVTQQAISATDCKLNKKEIWIKKMKPVLRLF